MSMMTTSDIDIISAKTPQKEHFIVAHCVFNMNTRAPGISVWKGAIIPILEALRDHVEKTHQFPCLEEHYLGTKRWWFVKEQYDNLLFRERCYNIAKIFASYLKRMDVEKVKILGLGISPSCGVREAQSDPTWGGRPREVDTSKNIALGKGVFIEEVEKAFNELGLVTDISDISPALIYPGRRVDATHTYPKDPVESLYETCSFFNIPCVYAFPKEKIAKIETITEDQRSTLNLVLPHSIFTAEIDKVIEHAYNGYGLIIIEDVAGDDEELDFIASVYAQQIGNQIIGGHTIRYYINSTPELELMELVMEKLGPLIRRQNFKTIVTL